MTTGIPPTESPQFTQRIREFALVALGLSREPLDAFPTIRMLRDAGVINVSSRYTVGGPGGVGGGSASNPPNRPIIVEAAVDRSPPPAPGGFEAISGTTQILFETANPVYRQGRGHSRTKVYAAQWDGISALPTFGDAVLYTEFPGNVGVAPFDPASTLRLWATWVSRDGVESEPSGGTNGIAAATGLIEDQHIANLTVGKLLAGSLAVGQYIQSSDYVANTAGWRIQTTAGGAAFLEINGGAYIGGTIVASDHIRSVNYVAGVSGWRMKADGTGQIGGFLVKTGAVESSNFVLNTAGWQLKMDGTGQIGGFQVRTADVRSSNYVAGTTGWKIDKDGSIEAANLTLTGGVIRNSTDSFNMNMSATGSTILLRAGTQQWYGSYAGWRYPVEIRADGSAFFGRGAVSGGTLLASGGNYAIPDAERPAIIFQSSPTIDMGG